ACPPNEKFSDCGPSCQKSCDTIKNPPKSCATVCDKGCFCNEGFIREFDNRNFLPGDEVIGDSFQPLLLEVWRWLPHMPRHCVNTLRGIVKRSANSTTAAKISVRQVKPFEVGRERAMLKEEDNILSRGDARNLPTGTSKVFLI
ncbi:hypothetical protein AVEN_22619-1, partial [Araneus ventricosus]